MCFSYRGWPLKFAAAILSLFCLACAGEALAFESGETAQFITQKNSNIETKAQLNSDSSILGRGYDENFEDTDADGNQHQLWPNRFEERSVNRYQVRVVKIDDALKMRAAAKFLFGSAQLEAVQNRRYLWVQVHHITRIVSLVKSGPPSGNAQFVAESLQFGTSFNAIVEGSEDDFTADLAAGILGGSVSLEETRKNHNLKVEYVADGLRLKDGKEVPLTSNVQAIMDAFEEDAVEQPIIVGFRALNTFATDKIQWKRNQFQPGRYRLVTMHFKVKETKDSGMAWDGLGDPPDPWFSGSYGKQDLGAMCKEKNRLEVVCSPDIVLDLRNGDKFTGQVWEKDMLEDDFVGGLVEVDFFKIKEAQPSSEFDVKVTGQLAYMRLRLEPLR